jgi:hypothetical protein
MRDSNKIIKKPFLKVMTMYLPGVLPLTLSKRDFFLVFESKFSRNRDLWVFVLVSDRFQPTHNSEVSGSRPNPRFQIFRAEYLGTYAL